MPVYMKYEGIEGEVRGKYKGWIEIEFVNFSRGYGNHEAAIGTRFDSTSAKLQYEAVNGEGRKVEIVFVSDDGEDYLFIELEQVMISGYSISGSGERAHESLSLNYTKITYTPKPSAPPSGDVAGKIKTFVLSLLDGIN